jgi:hypothetical protein
VAGLPMERYVYTLQQLRAASWSATRALADKDSASNDAWRYDDVTSDDHGVEDDEEEDDARCVRGVVGPRYTDRQTEGGTVRDTSIEKDNGVHAHTDRRMRTCVPLYACYAQAADGDGGM